MKIFIYELDRRSFNKSAKTSCPQENFLKKKSMVYQYFHKIATL